MADPAVKELKVRTLGTGAVPAAEVGVAPGVIVTVQEDDGFNAVVQVENEVVPEGKAGLIASDKFEAMVVPLFVTVTTRGEPLTARARLATLVVRVVDPIVSCPPPPPHELKQMEMMATATAMSFFMGRS